MNLTAVMATAALLVACSMSTSAAEAPVGIVEEPCLPTLSPPDLLVKQVRSLLLEPHAVTPTELKAFQDDPQLKAYNEASFARARLDWANLCRYREDNARVRASGAVPRVVFMGDSITEFWTVADAAFFADKLINRGISGQTTSQMLVRFQADVVALRPKFVHILGGTNDVAGNTGPSSPEDFKNNIRAMVEMAKAHQIGVLVGSVPPTATFNWRPQIKPVPTIQALNTWLRDYATQQGIGFIDYYAALAGPSGELKAELGNDGVHPNVNGYRIMRRLFEERLAAAETLARQAAIPDTPGSGKFPALKEETPSLPDHVIYRPADLARLGKNETRSVYLRQRGLLQRWGQLAAASARDRFAWIPGHRARGVFVPGQGRARLLRRPFELVRPTSSSALDWALAQNGDRTSPYYKKIDPKAVAVSGFSCGGLQALEIAQDPRIQTVIVMNSGILNPGSNVSDSRDESAKEPARDVAHPNAVHPRRRDGYRLSQRHRRRPAHRQSAGVPRQRPACRPRRHVLGTKWRQGRRRGGCLARLATAW